MVAVEELVVVPELVGRQAWDVEGAREDTELLWWIGRFRFVTVEAAASRLGVSRQRANARLGRLQDKRLVGGTRAHRSEPFAWFLTPAGSLLVGGQRRRPPRADVQRGHEAQIVELIGRLEAEHPGCRVLTERECRTLEADPEREDCRFSVELSTRQFGARRHWPDIVLLDGQERVAVEVELTPKATPRLKAILAGYRDSTYTTVRYLVPPGPIAARVRRCASQAGLPGVSPGPWHQTLLELVDLPSPLTRPANGPRDRTRSSGER